MVDRLLDLPGSAYSCVADADTGEIVVESGRATVEPATVLRWGMEASDVLAGPAGGGMEDLILTSGGYYHLLRPLGGGRSLIYLCVDRAKANLAVARRELAAARPESAVAPDPRPPAASRMAAAMPPASRGAVEVPLPRRPGSTTLPPVAAPPGRPRSAAPVLGQAWADDTATMSRLLVALRAMSGRAESE